MINVAPRMRAATKSSLEKVAGDATNSAIAEKSQTKRVNGKFAPGHSGNPAGRLPGTRAKATMAALNILEGEVEQLSRKAVELALGGDVTALRLCLERICSPARDRPVSLAMPKIERAADLIGATAALTAATADGTITPSEASDLVRLVEGTARAIETADLAERLAKLEEQLAAKGGTP